MLISSALLRNAAVLSAALVLLLGCGGDRDESVTDPPATTAGSTTSPSEEATSPAPGSDAPTESADPSSAATGAAPATGPRMEIRGLALNVPEGWEIAPGEFSEAAIDTGQSGGQILTAATTAIAGVETTDSLAKASLRAAKQDGLAPVRQDDRTVGGAEGFVVTGSSDLYPTWFEFGGVGTNGYAVTITISFVLDLPPAETDGYIDSILASVSYPPA